MFHSRLTIIAVIVIMSISRITFAQDTAEKPESADNGVSSGTNDNLDLGLQREHATYESESSRSEQAKEMLARSGRSLRLGGGVSHRLWYAHVKVPGANATVNYNISQSLLFMGHAETRFDGTRVSLKYAKNRFKEEFGDDPAESADNLDREASTYFIGEVDLGSYRFGYERSRIKGTSEYKFDNLVVDYKKFSTEYERYDFLMLAGDGSYLGLELERYAMPSVIGFRDDSETIVYVAFDDNLKVNNYSFVGGYDALASAKKNATSASTPYLSWNLGLGLAALSISDNVENGARAFTGKGDIDNVIITFKGMFELGYFYQKPPETDDGPGYSIGLGYRLQATYMDPANADTILNILGHIFLDTEDDIIDENERIEPDELELEFRRTDMVHGPFIEASIIF